MSGRLRRVAVSHSNPRSLSARARARRQLEFASRFPQLAGMRVLDLGGTAEYWNLQDLRPEHVTVLNVQGSPADGDDRITVLRGDACDPPPLGAFDLVVSNSVIEHVGGHWRRQRFAEVVHDAAPRYWIQTPYRYFPIEPHWLAPGFQHLPHRLQASVTKHWRGGHRHEPDHDRAVELALDVELLDITSLRHYFPDADLWRERFAGLTKSLVAVRS